MEKDAQESCLICDDLCKYSSQMTQIKKGEQKDYLRGAGKVKATDKIH